MKIIYFILGIIFMTPIAPMCQAPRLMAPIGHATEVGCAVFDQEDKLIASASIDGMVLIWDVASGRLLNAIPTSVLNIEYIYFIAHTNHVAILSTDESRVVILDYKTGQVFKSFITHSDLIESLGITPDGKYAVTASDQEVKVWNLRNSQPMYTLLKGEEKFNAVRFTDDLKYLVTSSDDSTFTVWNGLNGKRIYRSPKKEYVITAIAISNDGKYIATGGNALDLWKISDQKVIRHQKRIDSSFSYYRSAVFSGDDAKLIARNSGVISYDIKAGTLNRYSASLSYHGDELSSNSINYDGSKILQIDRSGLYYAGDSPDKPIYVTGDPSQFISTAWFSHDKSKIVTASEDRTVSVWDASDRGLIFSLMGHNNALFGARFTHDSRYFIGFASDTSYKVFDVLSGEVVKNIGGAGPDVPYTFDLSEDANYFLTETNEGTYNVVSTKNFEVSYSIKTDRTAAYTGFSHHSDKIMIDVDSNLMIYKLHDTLPELILPVPRVAFETFSFVTRHMSFDFSYDDKHIVVRREGVVFVYTPGKDGLADRHEYRGFGNMALDPTAGNLALFSRGNFKIVSLDDTTKITDLKRDAGVPGYFSPDEVAYSPDGRYIVSADLDSKLLAVWDAKNGDHLYTRKLEGLSKAVKQFKLLNSQSFSSDGRYLMLPLINNVAIYRLSDGVIDTVLKGHKADVLSASFSRDGKFILTTSLDYTTKIWDQSSHSLIYNAYSVNKLDYLNTDPNNERFDGSLNARRLMYYLCGDEIIALDQLTRYSYEPHLVSKLNKLNPGEPFLSNAGNNHAICNYLPVIRSSRVNRNDFHFEIIPRAGGLGKTSLYVNDKQIMTWNVSQLKKVGDRYTMDIRYNQLNKYLPSDSRNKISLRATSRDGTVLSKGPPEPIRAQEGSLVKKETVTHIFCLSVGICKYRGAELDSLQFCARDAIDFDKIIGQASRALFNKKNVEHVTNFVLSTDLDSAHWPLKRNIEQKLKMIADSAKADDIVIIFLSGHGILGATNTGQEFYYLTAEAPGFTMTMNERKAAAISKSELEKWMHEILAQKQLLIVDACHSGEIITRSFSKGDPDEEKIIFEDLSQTTGSYLLSASAYDQSAYEPSELGKSVLAYGLFKGIKYGNALMNAEYLDVNKWFQSTRDEVVDYTRDRRERQIPQINLNGTIQIGYVSQSLKDSISVDPKSTFTKSVCLSSMGNDNLLKIGRRIDSILMRLSRLGTARLIGFNPYADAKDLYQMNSLYTVDGDKVTFDVWIYQGAKEIDRFKVATNINTLGELDKKVIEAIYRKFN